MTRAGRRTEPLDPPPAPLADEQADPYLGGLRCAIHEIEDRAGVTMPITALRRLVFTTKGVNQRSFKGYSSRSRWSDREGMDTLDREEALDLFATYIGADDGWPILMDAPEKHQRFVELIHQGVAEGKLTYFDPPTEAVA